MTWLHLSDLRKSYGTVAAVDGLDLDVAAGTRTAIVGPSGCGKSTLLRIIAGFETPDSGRVTLGGATMVQDGVSVPAHRRRIGIVTQDGSLFPHLSVADNLGFGLSRQTLSRQDTVDGLMDLVGLPRAMLAQRPDQLSGGQQQRVALARALAREPLLMLLDEPFSALDSALRLTTRDAVADLLAAKGITTVLVTHDQGEALSFADQVAVMRDGRFRRVGPPRDVYLRPHDAEVAAFLGDAVLLPGIMVGDRVDCPLGQIEVDAPERRGEVWLMLRPEQIRTTAAAGEAVIGRVVATRFRGAVSTVLVRLDAASAMEPLNLQIQGPSVPEVGDALALTVVGTAHVLAP